MSAWNWCETYSIGEYHSDTPEEAPGWYLRQTLIFGLYFKSYAAVQKNPICFVKITSWCVIDASLPCLESSQLVLVWVGSPRETVVVSEKKKWSLICAMV